MNFERIKEFTKFFSLTNKTLKLKISLSCSLIWIVLVGYLTWWNGLSSRALDKSFQWDEWFWFGIIPAITPYFFYFVWKTREDEKLTLNKNFQKNDKWAPETINFILNIIDKSLQELSDDKISNLLKD